MEKIHFEILYHIYFTIYASILYVTATVADTLTGCFGPSPAQRPEAKSPRPTPGAFTVNRSCSECRPTLAIAARLAEASPAPCPASLQPTIPGGQHWHPWHQLGLIEKTRLHLQHQATQGHGARRRLAAIWQRLRREQHTGWPFAHAPSSHPAKIAIACLKDHHE